MNIEIKHLNQNDIVHFTDLVRVFADVFDMEPFRLPDVNYLQKLLRRKEFIVLAAILGNDVVGGLTAHILPSCYSETSEVYIYDLAVKPIHQRKGIGRKLLVSLSEYCKMSGFREFFVQADVDDVHALDFYQSTGGLAEKVVHYSYTTTTEANNL